MRNNSDSLYESGLRNKLRMLQEIGLLIQHVDFEQVLENNDRTGEVASNPLYHTGIFMMDTINELFAVAEEVDEENLDEFRALRERLGPDDPVQEFHDKSRSGIFKALSEDRDLMVKVGAIFNEGGSSFEALKSMAESIYSQIPHPEGVNSNADQVAGDDADQQAVNE